MKILNRTDDRADKWKLSLEYKIFIAFVRNLWLHAGFFKKNWNVDGELCKKDDGGESHGRRIRSYCWKALASFVKS